VNCLVNFQRIGGRGNICNVCSKMLTLEEKKNFVSYENLPLNGRIPAVLSDQLSKR